MLAWSLWRLPMLVCCRMRFATSSNSLLSTFPSPFKSNILNAISKWRRDAENEKNKEVTNKVRKFLPKFTIFHQFTDAKKATNHFFNYVSIKSYGSWTMLEMRKTSKMPFTVPKASFNMSLKTVLISHCAQLFCLQVFDCLTVEIIIFSDVHSRDITNRLASCKIFNMLSLHKKKWVHIKSFRWKSFILAFKLYQ